MAPTALDVVDPTPTDSEIVVTGSRIARPEIDSPSPIVSISSATLEQSGRTNLTGLPRTRTLRCWAPLPAQTSPSTASFGGAGTNLHLICVIWAPIAPWYWLMGAARRGSFLERRQSISIRFEGLNRKYRDTDRRRGLQPFTVRTAYPASSILN